MQTYIYFSKIKCFLCASIVPHCAKMHRNPKRATEGLFILVIYIYIYYLGFGAKNCLIFSIFFTVTVYPLTHFQQYQGPMMRYGVENLCIRFFPKKIYKLCMFSHIFHDISIFSKGLQNRYINRLNVRMEEILYGKATIYLRIRATLLMKNYNKHLLK